jgi:hypothetical protein|tara:strand:- start:1757 stop:1957 length:201 start_codon:yes stop_codon:yes gene_type:complete
MKNNPIQLSEVLAGIKLLLEMEKKGHKIDDSSKELLEIVAKIISKKYSPHMFDEDEQRLICKLAKP